MTEKTKKNERTAYQKSYRQHYKNHHKRINLTLSLAEYAPFATLANDENIAVSSLVKNMATAYLQQKTVVPQHIEAELKAVKFLIKNIANNINQTAHHSHIMNQLINENELLAEIKKLEHIVTDYTLKQLKKSHDY